MALLWLRLVGIIQTERPQRNTLPECDDDWVSEPKAKFLCFVMSLKTLKRWIRVILTSQSCALCTTYVLFVVFFSFSLFFAPYANAFSCVFHLFSAVQNLKMRLILLKLFRNWIGLRLTLLPNDAAAATVSSHLQDSRNHPEVLAYRTWTVRYLLLL